MNSNEGLVELAAHLRHVAPTFQLTVETADSGMTFLHVNQGGRCFVIAYYPNEDGYGVDEVLEGEGFEMGYKYWFRELEPATRKLLSLLKEAE